jgi:small-conductance mechanosensitive channel
MSQKGFLIKVVVLQVLFFLSICSPGLAQVSLLDSIQNVNPIAIANTDLSGKMLLVKEQLKSANRKLEPHKPILKIDTLLPKYTKFLTQQEESFSNFKKSHPNKQKVINLMNKWGSYYAFLDTWQSSINYYLDKNTIWIDQLTPLEEEWVLTYKAALAQKVDFEVASNIRSTGNQISKVITRINKQNNYLLKLEVRILIQKERINAITDELEAWKKSNEFAVFEKRHDAIWNFSSIQKDTKQSEKFNSLDSFKGNLLGLWTYLQSPENKPISFSIVLVLLSFWFWRLRKSFLETPIDHEDKKLLQAKLLLLKHLKPSVTFSITIVCIVYFSNTPNLLSQLLLIVALVSTIPLFKPITNKHFNGLIYMIILLFLMNTVKSYIWYSSIVYRGYLALEAILALAIVAKFIFPFNKVRRLEISSNYRLILFLSPVLYLVLTGALISNILGYTNLTDLLLKVGIEGSVLFLILTSMLIILGGLGVGSVHFYVSKLSTFDPKFSYFLQKRTSQLVTIFSYFFITVYFLHIIDMYDIVVIWVEEQLTEPIVWASISFTLGNIINFFLILFGSYALTSFISRSVNGGVLNFMKLTKGVPSIISVIVRYFLIAFAFVIALSTIGIDLGKFNLMAGALGLGIGFGLQNIISNFVSGLILIFERPVQTSDVVEVGSLLGEVTKIGVRSSNIRTFDGAEVVVPNSNFISNEVINWTLSDNIKRMEIKIGAAYGTDLQKVLNILKEETLKHKSVLKDPEPNALFDQFGESSLDFRIRFWVPVEFALQTKSDISISIYNAFTEAEITIPFPQRDVHINTTDSSTIETS